MNHNIHRVNEFWNSRGRNQAGQHKAIANAQLFQLLFVLLSQNSVADQQESNIGMRFQNSRRGFDEILVALQWE